MFNERNVPKFIQDSIEFGEKGEKASAYEVASQMFALTRIGDVLTTLCQDFEEVERLERYGNYIKVRVATRGKSLGHLFGLIEQVK